LRNTFTRFAATLLAFFVFGLALAGDAIPFKGSGSGVAFSVGQSLQIDSTGHSTLLGRYTRVEVIEIDGTGGVIGRADFFTENGEYLSIDIVGQFISPTTVEGTYTVNRGSGHFEDVTGSAAFTAVSTDGIHVTYQFNGFLSGFPG
jgi:hypothetical protein